MPKIELKNPFANLQTNAQKLVDQVKAGVTRAEAEVVKDTKVAGGWVAKAAQKTVGPLAPAPIKFDGTPSGQNAGWLQKTPPPPPDGTARFRELHEAAKAGRNTLPPDAKDYKYLMVGGLFTQHYPGYMD